MSQFAKDHAQDLNDPNYRLAYLEHVNELYRTQIAYLLAELHRIGWTPYSEDPHEAQ